MSSFDVVRSDLSGAPDAWRIARARSSEAFEQPSPVSVEQDLELVRAALAGSAGATERLVRRLECVGRILAAKNARMGTPLGEDELVDLAQDVFATVWKKLSGYRGRACFETWVYPFCVLRLMNAVRRKQRTWGLRARREERLPASSPQSVPALDYEALYCGLARLPERQAEVIRSRYFEGLAFEDIAARAGVPLGTVKTDFYRGMERLRGLLAHTLRREEP